MNFLGDSGEQKSDAGLVAFQPRYTNPRNHSIQDYFTSSYSYTNKSEDESNVSIIRNRDGGVLLSWPSTDPRDFGWNLTEDLGISALIYDVDFSISEQTISAEDLISKSVTRAISTNYRRT